MQYDPIKNSLGKVFNRTTTARKAFYHLLDLLLLRTWHVKKALRQYAHGRKEPANVLDAGSGFGQYTYHMARKHRNWNIEAVDVKTEQIADCRQFFAKTNIKNVSFNYADLTQYVEPDSYDLVLSVDVMEQIEEDVLVFKNFHKSMRPGVCC